MKKILLVFIPLALVVACQQQNGSSTTDALSEVHPGKKLMETNCYLCHSPSAPELEGRIGPPMAAVKAYYLLGNPSAAQFTAKLKDFLNAPSADKALMKEAVARHGLMPYQQYPEEVINQIADFMFHYQIEEPDWFKASWETIHGPGYQQPGKALTENRSTAKSLEDIGLEYALNTKKVLGAKLMGAIQEKGPAYAMEFCHTQAIPLTDSMSRLYDARIKRVSDKNRNPDNKANREELKYIQQFKQEIADGKEPGPVVVSANGIAHFYYPIVTNSMCLNCHGKDKDISPEVKSRISRLYPDDKAIGYAENEVRGIFSIELKKK